MMKKKEIGKETELQTNAQTLSEMRGRISRIDLHAVEKKIGVPQEAGT